MKKKTKKMDIREGCPIDSTEEIEGWEKNSENEWVETASE